MLITYNRPPTSVYCGVSNILLSRCFKFEGMKLPLIREHFILQFEFSGASLDLNGFNTDIKYRMKPPKKKVQEKILIYFAQARMFIRDRFLLTAFMSRGLG